MPSFPNFCFHWKGVLLVKQGIGKRPALFCKEAEPVLNNYKMSIFQKNKDKLRQAFEEREAVMWPLIAADVPRAGGEEFIRAERWKNHVKQASRYPDIAEIVKVKVDLTSDTGELVITLRSVDSKTVASLWLQREPGSEPMNPEHPTTGWMRVRSITNY